MHQVFPVARRGAFALAVAAATVCAQGPLSAQNTGDSQPDPALQDMTPEQLVLFYLSREQVVVAGAGFVSAQVDDPLSSVLGIWGDPVSQDGSGYVYRPVQGLTVTFTGKDAVRTITCEGTYAAPFRTGRGARFGMSVQEVTSLYQDARGKTGSGRVEYAGLGITFVFADNALNKVVVYAAKD